MDCKPAKLLYPQHFPGKKTRMSCHSLLQGIFLTQESSLHLLYCRWILYCWATREAQVSSVGTWNRLLLFIPAYGFVFNYYCLDSYFGEGNGTPLQYSCLENPMDGGALWAPVHGVAKSRTRLSDFTFTFHFHALEKEMATHSSVLAWRIPGTGEPGGLPSMGSHRVWHNWSNLAAAAAADSYLDAEFHSEARVNL